MNRRHRKKIIWPLLALYLLVSTLAGLTHIHTPDHMDIFPEFHAEQCQHPADHPDEDCLACHFIKSHFYHAATAFLPFSIEEQVEKDVCHVFSANSPCHALTRAPPVLS